MDHRGPSFEKRWCRRQLAISGVFRIYKRGGGGATFDKLQSCNKAESQTEILVGVRMIF